jgi:Transposase IS116/IS110/IS902 family
MTRFKSEAAFARYAGVAPVPAWSGATQGRLRAMRGGNRQLNSALHRIAVVQIRPRLPQAGRIFVAGSPKAIQDAADARPCQRDPGDFVRGPEHWTQCGDRNRRVHRNRRRVGCAGHRCVDESDALACAGRRRGAAEHVLDLPGRTMIGATIAVGFEYILRGRATAAGAEAAQGGLGPADADL